MPLPEDELPAAVAEEPDEVDVEDAQTPVEFPQREHQVAWSPMANLFISDTKVVHGSVVSDCPNNG